MFFFPLTRLLVTVVTDSFTDNRAAVVLTRWLPRWKGTADEDATKRSMLVMSSRPSPRKPDGTSPHLLFSPPHSRFFLPAVRSPHFILPQSHYCSRVPSAGQPVTPHVWNVTAEKHEWIHTGSWWFYRERFLPATVWHVDRKSCDVRLLPHLQFSLDRPPAVDGRKRKRTAGTCSPRVVLLPVWAQLSCLFCLFVFITPHVFALRCYLLSNNYRGKKFECICKC